MKRFDESPIRADEDSGRGRSFECSGCKEIIGVYEPLVVVDDVNVRSTSRAAEPELEVTVGEHYHRDCYVARHGCERLP